MPAFETMDLIHDAVLWAAAGSDSDGDPTVSDAPLDISVRFVKKQSQALDPKGNVLTVDWTMVADMEIAIDSRVWQGTLDDLPGTNPNPPDSGTMWVVTNEFTDSLKGREERTTYGLKFYKDSIGTAVTVPD